MIARSMVGGFRAELKRLLASRLFIALTLVQAVTFLVLVSLFGLTGSRAPVAVVCDDNGAAADLFIRTLSDVHRSFNVRRMDRAESNAALKGGELVAIITIPSTFSADIARRVTSTIDVKVDNVDTDLTDDVQRALPAAVVSFGHRLRFPEIHLRVAEKDLVDHDTDFIPYLVVSGLALDAFVVAAMLAAITVAREFESGTVRYLAVAPAPSLAPLAGSALATAVVSALVMLVPFALVVFGYGVRPIHPVEAIGGLMLCVLIFTCVGVALGAALKRTLPVASLVFGLAMPLYLCSGSLEPARFDGERLWAIAHLSPVYYAVGVMEQAFHGLQVTPESVTFDLVALLVWAGVTLLVAGRTLRRQLT